MNNPPQTARFTRGAIAEKILARFDDATVEATRRQFTQSRHTQWFSVDDLLPEDMATTIHEAFPDSSRMRERKTLREHKYVAAQMDRYDPQAEEALFAFHDDRVVELVERITGMRSLEADPNLYAGGISLMRRGNFLNPHLDNSHNNERTRYRVLNLLYYVSPGWQTASGGHLELWPDGLKRKPEVVESLFNRLVVMTTGPESWHSVCAVRSDQPRCCVSNYYFSEEPVGGADYSRVTTFRGRPEQPLRDLVLLADGKLRQFVRRLRPEGIVSTTHVYNRRDER